MRVNISVPDRRRALWDQCVAAAAADGVSVSQWLVDTAESRLAAGESWEPPLVVLVRNAVRQYVAETLSGLADADSVV